MRKSVTSTCVCIPLFVAIVVCLAVVEPVAAKPPKGKPGGGGNDGPQYVVVDIGAGGATSAVDINNYGGVITRVSGLDALIELDGVGRTIRTTALPGIDSQFSEAYDLNDSFEIVGTADERDEFGQLVATGVMWRVDSSGAVQKIVLPAIPVPNGSISDTVARGVSSDGLIVGDALEFVRGEEGLGAVDQHAAAWQVELSGQINMVVIPGAAAAIDVNNQGIVVGADKILGKAVWALQFDADGKLVGVSNPIALPGLDDEVVLSVGQIRDDGQVVGASFAADGNDHAVLWTVHTNGQIELSDLGTATQVDSIAAAAVNARGEVVGNTLKITWKGKRLKSENRPFYADAAGIIDLNNLIVDYDGLNSLASAADNNESGWICGLAIAGSASRAYVAIPVP